MNAKGKVVNWQLIDKAPSKKVIMAWGPDWIEPGVVMLNEDGIWYDPSTGFDVFPTPTHWMPLPEPPVLPK